MKRRTALNILLVLFAQITFTVYGLPQTLIVGKVIDSSGDPAVGAQIFFIPDRDTDIVSVAKTDEVGHFEMRVDTVPAGSMIWVTNFIDWKNRLVLISPGIDLTLKYAEPHKPISFLESQSGKKVDIGTTAIQVYYSKVNIVFDPSSLERLLNSKTTTELRVVDPSGEVAAETSLIRRYVANSTFYISLPNGKWSLELKNSNGKWESLAREVDAKAGNEIVVHYHN
jgi:hypothetical protein